MESGHLNNEALVSAIYGLAGAREAAHLAACPRCAAALQEAEQKRRDALDGAVERLPDAFWQRQRETVVAAALEAAPSPFGLRAFAFSLAVLLALAAALVARPRPAVSPVIRAEDEQLLRDIYYTVNRLEPRALAPVALLLPDPTKEVKSR